MRQTDNLTASHWRTAHRHFPNTVGGLSACFLNTLIELSNTPTGSGGLLGGLTPFCVGLLGIAVPDRQTAIGVTAVAE
jgi:hypothetical protein